MQLYWIEFEDPPPLGLGLGVGVTAIDDDDAKKLVTSQFGDVVIAGMRVIENIDQLEQNHVRPNIGNFLKRGMWYPRYSDW